MPVASRIWSLPSASGPNEVPRCVVVVEDESKILRSQLNLLKGFDERGFVFYTNEQSEKGRELAANPRAALVFHWKSLQRQVRLRGALKPGGGLRAITDLLHPYGDALYADFAGHV